MATRAERRQVTQNRLKAMQHPLRAEVFRLIRESPGPVSPAEVARELEADVPSVSYHVRKLGEYDCVEEVENRPVRGVIEHFYRATEQQRLDLEEWAELAEAEPEVAEVLTDEFMQTIVDDYTASRRASIVGRDERFAITRNPLLLDEEGLDEALEAVAAYEAKMAEIAARSAARLDAEDPGVPVSSSIVLFKMPTRRFGSR
ncbi:MAG TPA: helix-turn-helix domain-containing protein [Solirubrobacterales bacterium]|nr:helix-turn-helix domain-containing protein [Solirubrobacterales bacterium]